MLFNPVSCAEPARRLPAARAAVAVQGLEIAVIAAPESVFRLAMVDHRGTFAPRHLIVPEAGDFARVGRAMERATGAPIPFAGMKQSGLGLEGSRPGMEEFTEIAYVCRDLR